MDRDEAIKVIEFLQRTKTETNEIEAKSALNGCPEKLYDTISAFANKNGGTIVFGLNENKGFLAEGVYDASDLQKNISNLCSQAMEPVIRPEITTLEYQGQTLVVVYIPEMEQVRKPCYYRKKGIKGGSYIRVGDRDDLMTDYELYTLSCYKDRVFDDKRPNISAELEDLDNDALDKYIVKLRLNKPNLENVSIEKCLNLCEITTQKNDQIYPTLAGTMIFGKYPQFSYPQLFVACTVIPGKDLGALGPDGERFIDNQRVEGTIEEMLYGTMAFLRRNMKTKVIIDSFGIRKDITEYPLDALKEVVANALVHRDYSSMCENSYIAVMMFSDRVEIISPGALYGRNKIGKLDSFESMEVRNPTIIRLLEEDHSIIENRRTGIKTIVDEMRKYGHPDPEFIEYRDTFRVILRKKKESEQVYIVNTPTLKHSNNKLKKEEKTDKTKSQTINQNQQIVLDFCKEPKSINNILNHLNLSSKRHLREKILCPLIKSGRLTYTNENVHARNQKYVTKIKKK